jgi:uncharacterized protein (DUF4415 family)
MSDKPVVFDDDNPEWTKEDFAKAKPLSAFPELEAALKRRGGRPSQDKQQVTLRIDRDVLERFKAGGPGWQTRINDALRKVGA